MQQSPFTTVEELDNVPNIGDKTMEMLEKDVSVSGKLAAVMGKSGMHESRQHRNQYW